MGKCKKKNYREYCDSGNGDGVYSKWPGLVNPKRSKRLAKKIKDQCSESKDQYENYSYYLMRINIQYENGKRVDQTKYIVLNLCLDCIANLLNLYIKNNNLEKQFIISHNFSVINQNFLTSSYLLDILTHNKINPSEIRSHTDKMEDLIKTYLKTFLIDRYNDDWSFSVTTTK